MSSGIPLVLGFKRGMASPLDVDYPVADITARNAIDPNIRFPGMTCYVDSDGNIYYLSGGIDNANWALLSGGGSGSSGPVNYLNAVNFKLPGCGPSYFSDNQVIFYGGTDSASVFSAGYQQRGVFSTMVLYFNFFSTDAGKTVSVSCVDISSTVLASGVSSAVPVGGQVTVTLTFGAPVDVFNLFTLNITLSDFSASQFSLDAVTIE